MRRRLSASSGGGFQTTTTSSTSTLLIVAVVVGLVSLFWGSTGAWAWWWKVTSFSKTILSGSVLEAFNQLGYAGRENDEDSLRAIIHNVTTDMDQLILIVEDFLDTQEDKTKLKAEFKDFLLQAEKTSFVSVERTLDSILWVYKFLLPFLGFRLLGLFWGPRAKSRSSGRVKPVSSSSPSPAPSRSNSRKTSPKRH